MVTNTLSLGLGLHRQGDLIDAQADPGGHGVDERPFPVQARIGDAQKLSEARNHRDLRGVHREEAAQNREITKKARRLNTTQPKTSILILIFPVRHAPIGHRTAPRTKARCRRHRHHPSRASRIGRLVEMRP
jgi:hypothetical protein